MFLLRSYHGSKLARQVMDKMNLAKIVLQTTLFDLPEKEARRDLLNTLPEGIYPRVEEQPVLIETWQKAGERQVHLMNYDDGPKERWCILKGL